MKHYPVVFIVVAALSAPVAAQVSVKDPWVRGTVPEQRATGAFMRILAPDGGKLVQVSSPVAGAVEIHETVLEGTVMRMRPVPALELPAGRTVGLEPGGHHLMLLDLKRALKQGEQVPLTLVVAKDGSRRETIEVSAPVRALATDKHGHEKP